MTLTSSNTSKHPIKKSFDILRKRIARAKYEKDGFLGFKFNRYFCLRTSEGNTVLHIVYWGQYIPQRWLSRTWNKIHGAKIVDIRKCYSNRRKVNGLVGYLLSRYLQNQPIERMSYGWRWAWLGFCKSWTKFKQIYGAMRKSTYSSFRLLGSYAIYHTVRWQGCFSYLPMYIVEGYNFFGKYSNQSVRAWLTTLWIPPPTTYMRKLEKYL